MMKFCALTLFVVSISSVANAQMISGVVEIASNANGRCGASESGMIFDASDFNICADFCNEQTLSNMAHQAYVTTELKAAAHLGNRITLDVDVAGECLN